MDIDNFLDIENRTAKEMGYLKRGDLCNGRHDVWESPSGELLAVPPGRLPIFAVFQPRGGE